MGYVCEQNQSRIFYSLCFNAVLSSGQLLLLYMLLSQKLRSKMVYENLYMQKQLKPYYEYRSTFGTNEIKIYSLVELVRV